jgi:hypothetical protein
MSDVLKNGFLIILTIGLLYLIFLRECKREECPPDGSVLVSQAFIDSLRSIANKPPIVIIKDSIVYRDTVIYIIKDPPIPIDTINKLRIYRDSIYNDSIRVWTEMHINGSLEVFNQWYRPIIHYRTKTIEIPKPYPVPHEVPVNKSGLYVSSIIGGGSRFMIGASVDYLNKKDVSYGMQYQRYGNDNIYGIRIGIKIK